MAQSCDMWIYSARKELWFITWVVNSIESNTAKNVISRNFPESLIDDINLDIEQASNSLDESDFKKFTQDAFFTSKVQNGHLWIVELLQ